MGESTQEYSMETQEADGKVPFIYQRCPRFTAKKASLETQRFFGPGLQDQKSFTRVISQKFNPRNIPSEAFGRGRGTPWLGLYCPPTKGRRQNRVPPLSAFLLMTSKTTPGAIYKGDTLGPDTGRHRSPTVSGPQEKQPYHRP